MKFLLICMIFIINIIKGDLPIDCLKSETQGTWEFISTELKQYQFLAENQCGHLMPDSYFLSQQSLDYKKDHQFSIKLTLTLKNDGSVKVVKNGFDKKKRLKKDPSQLASMWTMIYNEGFEIKINNHRILIFQHYENQGLGFTCDCAKSLVGWIYDESNKKAGCIFGRKLFSQPIIKPVKNLMGPVTPLQFQTKKKLVEFRFNQLMKKKTKTLTRFQLQASLVNYINSQHLTYKAKIIHDKREQYLLSKNSKVNRQKTLKNRIIHQNRVLTEPELLEFQSIENIDFNNYDSFVESGRQQGDCGSCYAMATMQMLEYRLKKEFNIDTKLSVQQSLDCNFYNQGCDGGYSYLVSKFANEFHIVDEECRTYREKTETGQCQKKLTCDLTRAYQAYDFKYVGGFYGFSNEYDIMKEIINNGPMVVSFAPDAGFDLYDSGIYEPGNFDNWIHKDQMQPEFTLVEHSVLCYGWGVENGVKYWKLANSWGTEWGQKGLFKMIRGQDAFGIESIGEAAKIKLLPQEEVEKIKKFYQD